MAKTTTFEIESLDQGFILTDRTKRIAFQDAESLESHLVARFKNEISAFKKHGNNNFSFELKTEENFPRCV